MPLELSFFCYLRVSKKVRITTERCVIREKKSFAFLILTAKMQVFVKLSSGKNLQKTREISLFSSLPPPPKKKSFLRFWYKKKFFSFSFSRKLLWNKFKQFLFISSHLILFLFFFSFFPSFL